MCVTKLKTTLRLECMRRCVHHSLIFTPRTHTESYKLSAFRSKSTQKHEPFPGGAKSLDSSYSSPLFSFGAVKKRSSWIVAAARSASSATCVPQRVATCVPSRGAGAIGANVYARGIQEDLRIVKICFNKPVSGD